MSKKASEIIKNKLEQSGGRVLVHSINGKVYEILAARDGISFLCDQLPIKPPYTYAVFDVIVELLIKQGGRAKKGKGRNAKLGEQGCEENSVVGYIGKKYFGKKPGDSVYDPVFVLASVLDWAGIAHNQRGYIQLSANFNR